MDASRLPGPAPARAHPTISVVGLGYIGLATACIFAAAGVKVIGVDIDEAVVRAVNDGVPHFCERDIGALLGRAVAAGRLGAVSNPAPADVFVLAVPTPVDAASRPDMRCLDTAARAIAPVLRPGNLVILESTSPVGTTRRIAQLIAGLRPDLACNIDAHRADGVSFAFCPERVIPGNMLRELVDNDRVVGGLTPAAAEAAAAVYRLVLKGACHTTSAEMAEMAKLAENAFRDVNLAFANELWQVCRRLGLDAYELIAIANRHPRVDILSPGPGVGGHCIAVDPWFIVDSAPADTPLIRAARQVNDAKPYRVVGHVRALCREHGWKRLLCVGLTYKADVDDFRCSPALTVACELTGLMGRNVACADPHAAALQARGVGRSLLVVELEAGLAWADAILCLVDHACYAEALGATAKPIIDVCGRRQAAQRPQLRLAARGRAVTGRAAAELPAA